MKPIVQPIRHVGTHRVQIGGERGHGWGVNEGMAGVDVRRREKILVAVES